MNAALPWLTKAAGKAVVVRNLLDARARDTAPQWRPFRAGIEILPLYGEGDGPSGSSAALLRYGPGASVPRHEHLDYEHVVVLSGSQQDASGRYEAGALVINEPGSRHEVRSEGGCVVLVIWSAPVEFLDPDLSGEATS